jgi:cell division protein ZapB
LTLARHSPYYRAMESELRALEERIGQLAALARRLRAENAELRQSLLMAQNDNRALNAKVESASTRLQRLLDRLPEEAA